MNLIPFGKKNREELVVTESGGDIEIRRGNQLQPRRGGTMVEVRSKQLRIGGKVHNIDPQQLIRMIKQVTQTIGEYKERDNPYASYVTGALRKARADMVSDLESHFGIHWEIDEASGRSVFYM